MRQLHLAVPVCFRSDCNYFLGAGLFTGIGYGAYPSGVAYGGAPFGSGYYSPYGANGYYAPITSNAAPVYTASAIPTAAPITAAETGIPSDYFNKGPEIVRLAPKKQQIVTAPVFAKETAIPTSAPIKKQEVAPPKYVVPTKVVSAPQEQPLFHAKAQFGFQAPAANFGNFPTAAFNTPFGGNQQQPPIILVQPQVTVQKPAQQPSSAQQQQQTNNVVQVTVDGSDGTETRRA